MAESTCKNESTNWGCSLCTLQCDSKTGQQASLFAHAQVVTMTVMGVMGMAVVRGLCALSAVVLVRMMRNAVLTHVSCVGLVCSVMLDVG